MFKTKYLKKLILLSKNGNFAIITAIIIPVILILSSAFIVFSNAMSIKSTIESSGEEALNRGIYLICSHDIQPPNAIEPILDDFKKILIKNSFTVEVADDIRKNTQVSILPDDHSDIQKKYILKMHTNYNNMPLNKFEKFFMLKKENIDLGIDVEEISNCRHEMMIMLHNPPSIHDTKYDYPEFIKALNSIIDHENVHLTMISGSITITGASYETKRFHNIFSKLRAPFLRGLGNEETLYHIGICNDNGLFFNLSSDSCVFNTINDLSWNLANNYKKIDTITRFNGDTRRSKYHVIISHHTITGSQAYSWNIGNVHFIQTNNSLFNTIRANDLISNTFEADIEPLIYYHGEISNWLKKDISEAVKRGDYIIICTNDVMHDSNAYQKNALLKLLADNKISTIFQNVWKNSDETKLFDSNGRKVTVYGIGNASKNEFIILEFHKNIIYVKNCIIKNRDQVYVKNKLSPIHLDK
ncbi:hypothetical protein [Candidatus Liberibacter brunswickensis]|uniref:hypothetical protein n=1 Tax=Candidatus Liberibacter brunswickensis TaxID=1968796 RepID=UPI002FE2683C